MDQAWHPHLKLNLTKREMIAYVGSKSLVERLIHHKWVTPLFRSQDPLYPRSRIEAAQRRMEAGEVPPLIAWERRVSQKRSDEQARRRAKPQLGAVA